MLELWSPLATSREMYEVTCLLLLLSARRVLSVKEGIGQMRPKEMRNSSIFSLFRECICDVSRVTKVMLEFSWPFWTKYK